jgi:glycine cleavage system H protein
VDGVVVAINDGLANNPEFVNQDALGKGWFARIKASIAEPLDGLLSKDDYEAQIRA